MSSLLVSAVIMTAWVLAILVLVVWEKLDAEREWRAIVRKGLNGSMRRTSLYVRRAVDMDLAQILLVLLFVVMVVISDGVYSIVGEEGKVVYRNVIRAVIILSMVPMFVRVWERWKLRRDQRIRYEHEHGEEDA